LVAFALIIFGVSFNNAVKFAGWQLLAIVVSVHLVVTTLGACIRGHRFMKLVRAIVALVLLALLAIGVLEVIGFIRSRQLDQPTELFLSAAVAFGIVILAGIAAVVRAMMRWAEVLFRESARNRRTEIDPGKKNPAENLELARTKSSDN
jgi:hypothetical protein